MGSRPPPHAVDHLAGAGASAAEAQPDADETPQAHPDVEGTSEVEAMPSEASVDAAPAEPATAPETEVFYTFTWGGFARKREQPRGKGRPQARPTASRAAKGKPGGKRPPKGAPKQTEFEARPPRKEKAIDPDNPFAAALMGLQGQKLSGRRGPRHNPAGQMAVASRGSSRPAAWRPRS